MIGETPVQSPPGQQTIADSIAGVYAVATRKQGFSAKPSNSVYKDVD